jgi:hypothetical protein
MAHGDPGRLKHEPHNLSASSGCRYGRSVSRVLDARHYGSSVIDDAASRRRAADLAEIDGIVEAFFAAFTSGDESAARLAAIRSLFHSAAVIVKTCGGAPVMYDLDGFIAPREALLSDGTLEDFREWKLSGHTEVFGDVAHWFGAYAKSGVQAGTPFTGRGMKSIQFVRTVDGWRITAAAWDDEREGRTIDGA